MHQEHQQVFSTLEPDIVPETAVLRRRYPTTLLEHHPKRTTFEPQQTKTYTGASHSRQGSSGGLSSPRMVLQLGHRLHAAEDSSNYRNMSEGFGRCVKFLVWYFLVAVYLYLFRLAGMRVNEALITASDANDGSKFDVAKTIGGALMCLTVPLATYHIVLHLSNFVEPRQQSQIVRIVLMVPIYSVTAFLSLRFMHWSLFITTVRECYEAYVIYCFLHFLVSTLGDGSAANSRLAAMPPVVGRHTPPFCCLEPWQMGREFLQRCQAGVFQYVLIRLLCTAVALVLQLGHLYTEGDFDPKRGYLWITVVTCLSQSWALYVLVLFYRATHKELVHIHPMGKFLAIKTIVFFSWWQGILIEFLEQQGHFADVVAPKSAEGKIPAKHDPSEHVAQGIQDLLICLEMLVAAVFFFYAFPLSDYLKNPSDDPSDTSPQHHRTSSGFRSHPEDPPEEETSLMDSNSNMTEGSMAEGSAKRKNILRDERGMPMVKSHPRLDVIGRRASSSSFQGTTRQQRLSVWEALKLSACPVELRLDLRATRASVGAHRGRFFERLASLTKRKVEARRESGSGVVVKIGRVLTL